mgnify:CR=1 FL=1
MTFSVCPFLRLAAVCGGALLCSSCLPMLGTGRCWRAAILRTACCPPPPWTWCGGGTSGPFPPPGWIRPGASRFPRGFLFPADGGAPRIAGEWACYHDRNSYYWAFVAGKKEEEAGLYAVRRGVAVNGTTGEIEDHPAAQAVKPPSVM